jgi:hypothetical protein
MDQRIVRARSVAPSLVGLTIDEVRRRIAEIPDLYLRETTPEEGVEQSLGFGRITVFVVAGKVVDARGG